MIDMLVIEENIPEITVIVCCQVDEFHGDDVYIRYAVVEGDLRNLDRLQVTRRERIETAPFTYIEAPLNDLENELFGIIKKLNTDKAWGKVFPTGSVINGAHVISVIWYYDGFCEDYENYEQISQY